MKKFSSFFYDESILNSDRKIIFCNADLCDTITCNWKLPLVSYGSRWVYFSLLNFLSCLLYICIVTSLTFFRSMLYKYVPFLFNLNTSSYHLSIIVTLLSDVVCSYFDIYSETEDYCNFKIYDITNQLYNSEWNFNHSKIDLLQ